MILTPYSILHCGKNKGYKLGLMFKYNPSHIGWLIKNVDEFVIDIRKFADLSGPTPADTHRTGIIEKPESEAPVGAQIKTFFLSVPGGRQKCGLRNNWNYKVDEALNLESWAIVIPSIKYFFPKEVISVNESKRSKLNQTI